MINSTFVKYIADRDHYTEVLERISKVKHHLWIGTADIKDLYMKKGNSPTPFLAIIDGLLKKGVVGIGMKSELRRNFEVGILTNESSLVEAVINQFDGVWMGSHCKKCGRKEYCSDRIV